MAATNYTPIQLYYSTTASAVPVNTNLAAGELAINTLDEKLYFKNSAGTVKLLASTASVAPVTTFSGGTTGLTPATATSGAITLAGTLAVANGGTGVTTSTGTGSVVLSTTPTLVTPVLGAATGTSLALSISALTSSNTGNFSIGGVLSFSDTGITANEVGTTNSYLQSVIQNKSAGASASAEFISYNDSGTATTNFSAFGINSTGYTGTGSINTAGYGYFITGSTDLVLGTIGANALHFVANSAATDAMNISSTGLINVNSSSAGTSLLTVTTSTSKSSFKTSNIAETDTISATAATGTINFDITTQSVLYYTSNASGNWTVNFRGSSGTSLNTLMATGESISATFLVTQGSTAYYNSAVTIDGNSVTPKWQGGTAPTSGNASAVDCYTYVIQKTGSATYVVLASVTKFA